MKSLMTVLASLAIGAAAAQPYGGSTAPVPVAAVRVDHALQATMLASTRAGARIVAVGDHGVVLLSDDDGQSHRQATSVPVDMTLNAVSFADAKHGWAVGHWGVVLNTTDGGETWKVQRMAPREDRPLFAVHFFDARRGVAVGLWSLVLTTSDGGDHWQQVQMPAPDGAKKADLNLLGLFVDARGRLYAPAEKGMVARSDDRGQHWNYLNTGYKGSFWTGVANTDGTLLVGGLRGSMYRSTDDGRSWQRLETHSQSSITALVSTGQHVIGVGLDGVMLRSADAGATFASEVRSDRVPLTAISLDGQGRPVLYSRQGVIKPGSMDTSAK